MKILYLLVVLTTLSFQLSYCQDYSSIDARLKVKFSESDIQRISETQPQVLKYETFRLDNSWYFIDIDANSNKPYPMLFEMDYQTKSKGQLVDEIDQGNFNILDYYLEPQVNKPIVYKIGNTGLGLVIIAEKELAEKYNISLTEK